jgi:hypothetical protein
MSVIVREKDYGIEFEFTGLRVDGGSEFVYFPRYIEDGGLQRAQLADDEVDKGGGGAFPGVGQVPHVDAEPGGRQGVGVSLV